MRDWGRGLLVVLLLIPALTATAKSESVRDDFNEVSYSGSDGSLDWAGSWSEIGESNGPATGQIRIVDTNCSNSRCLRLSGGTLGEVGVRRSADLSQLSTAVLEFDLHVGADLLSTGTLRIQARGNGLARQVTTSSTTSTTGSESEGEGEPATTTTTSIDTTTTNSTDTAVLVPAAANPPPGEGPPEPAIGLLVDFKPGMSGEMDIEEVEVLGVELEADFSLAVEVFQTVKIWVGLLMLLVAAVVVSGLESRGPLSLRR